jgi:hypothetical protein
MCNPRFDTPFWRQCRADIDAGEMTELVEYYREAGPVVLGKTLLRPLSIFGYDGYLKILIGSGLATKMRDRITADDRTRWNQFRDQIRTTTARAVPMRQALAMVHSPDWQWPTQGV